jgi:hypothetical protein
MRSPSSSTTLLADLHARIASVLAIHNEISAGGLTPFTANTRISQRHFVRTDSFEHRSASVGVETRGDELLTVHAPSQLSRTNRRAQTELTVQGDQLRLLRILHQSDFVLRVVCERWVSVRKKPCRGADSTWYLQVHIGRFETEQVRRSGRTGGLRLSEQLTRRAVRRESFWIG